MSVRRGSHAGTTTTKREFHESAYTNSCQGGDANRSGMPGTLCGSLLLTSAACRLYNGHLQRHPNREYRMAGFLRRYWFALALALLALAAVPGLVLSAMHLLGMDGPANRWLEDTYQ